MAGTMIGARLGHVLFYAPGYYFSHPVEILKIWEGGLASHGGTLGVIVGIWLYSRRYPQFSMMWMLDRLSIPTALVASFIRIGNLMNSEIIGKPADVPWSFVFLRVDNIPRHPGQLYESIAYFLLFVCTMTLYRRNPFRPAGFFFGIMLIWIFTARIFLEYFKENQEAFEQGMIMNMGQILSIPFVLFGLYLLINALRQPKKEREFATK
jgi:prolipoprotein diacylglyceryl transferase